MNDLSAVASADSDLVDLSADIVCAYVSHNALSVTDLPKLIADVHAALRALKGGDAAEPEEELRPAVPIRKSISPDFLVCLEDGKKFKCAGQQPPHPDSTERDVLDHHRRQQGRHDRS